MDDDYESFIDKVFGDTYITWGDIIIFGILIYFALTVFGVFPACKYC